jgi:alkylation response protein AidB-like acyl-CoA dehydrogenase
MVQLRSLDTHTPLKGIHVGDIGPKMGMSAVDNGYLRLEHVRIPRKNLLSRYFSIEKGGKYTAPPHSKLAYGSMLAVRMGLLEAASRASQLAATVAVRYRFVGLRHTRLYCML